MTRPADAIPYTVKFTNRPNNPREFLDPENGPTIRSYIDFGPYMNFCSHPWYCIPPPEVFAVEIDWNSPNDTTCWWPVSCILIWGHVCIYNEGFAD